MPAEADPGGIWYDYAIVRVVPHVERGEFLNAGVILFARTAAFLDVRIELDKQRLLALAADADFSQIERHLETFATIAGGDAAGGPIASLGQSQRFHWLTSPRSTVIQTSPIHVGRAGDPAAALQELMNDFVRRSPA